MNYKKIKIKKEGQLGQIFNQSIKLKRPRVEAVLLDRSALSFKLNSFVSMPTLAMLTC